MSVDKSKSTVSSIFEFLVKYFKIILILAFLLIIFSNIYTVDSGEVAVVLRFGALVEKDGEVVQNEAGLHYALPFVIDEVVIVPVGQVQELTVTTNYGYSTSGNISVTDTGYVITGDNNIAFIEIKAKYMITDAVQYALNINDIDSFIDGIISSESTQIIATMSIDEVLTTGKEELATNIMEQSQDALDIAGCGVTLTNIELLNVNPPVSTKIYFEAVTSASVEMETLIKLAEEEVSIMLEQAKQQAAELENEALSQQSQELSVVITEQALFEKYYDIIYDPDSTVEAGTDIVNTMLRERLVDVLLQAGYKVTVDDDEITIFLPQP